MKVEQEVNMDPKWYEKIDWQPFLWFGCFLVLIIIAMLIRQKPEMKIAGDLLLLAAGAISPRIRSSVKV